MSEGQGFVDYYAILQVAPDCDAKTLETAYRYLAKMYHPDHTESADVEKFNAVMGAYRALRNPDQRAEYDVLHAAHAKENWFKFPSNDDVGIDERSIVSDADVHARILMFLYKKRRENARNAGVAGFYVQQMLDCSEEHIDFHLWYLKEKGLIAITEQGSLAITIEGIDHVIAMSRTSMSEKLLIAQSARSRGTSDQARGGDSA